MTTTLHDHDETEVRALNIDVPAWISQDIDTYQVAAINEGGCASGAYMPAVIYYDACQTMSQHGDDVLQYLQDEFGELPRPNDNESWSGMAVHYLSYAVDLWVVGVAEQALAVLEELQEATPDA